MRKESYSVVICENESAQRELLLKLIEAYGEEKQLFLTTACFHSAEAFLFDYEENKKADLILLDIQMEALDGVAMAKQLRAQNDDVQIIFISGYSEHIGEGYQVEAVDYLLKPFSPLQLKEALDRAFKRIGKEKDVVLLETEEGIQKVELQNVLTIESAGRETEWELDSGESLTAKTGISDAAALLKDFPQFFQPHRTIIANLHHVEQLKKDEFIMGNGKQVPISRRTLKQAKDAFLSFHLKGEQLR